MMMKKKKWYKRFHSDLWIFKLEEFPNANPSFRIVCECICKVITHYANSSPTYCPLAHDESC